ncbi:MAG TPA: lysophospholipid acyltransferase family protein [Anaerovoracaceae bacterium]|nr:lysophospholipid acyltransferase family protein [Anaerovoracaceae bacterium]
MKIFGNIGSGVKLFHSVKVFNNCIKDIEAARQSGDTAKEREIIAAATYKWASNVTQLFDIHWHVKGLENVPPSGPVVFVANHQGYADIVAFLATIPGRQIGFVAKDGLQKAPYFGKWVKNIRGVFIKRGNPREALTSINEGIELLKQGFSLVIFPEGTRSQGGPIKTFKPGSFKLATKASVPIVPVTINGTYKIFEETGIITRGKDVDFIIHPAVETASLDRHASATLISDVENIIRAGMEKLNT